MKEQRILVGNSATLQGALELARDEYRKNAQQLRLNAKEVHETQSKGLNRLADQFDRQVGECVSFLEQLEEQD